MARNTTPNDPRKFTLTAFIAFVVVFVVAMLMMLWHGNSEHSANGEIHYNTRVLLP